MSASGSRLELKNLRKSFRTSDGQSVCAVSDLSLAVDGAGLLVLAGPSGCGKTTTLRLIAGLEHPDAGEIWLDGRALNAVRPAERNVALVFQSGALLPHLTAFDNLALGLRLRKTPRTEIDRRVRETAELLGISNCLSRRPRELSGGEQQRVALGRALVRRPSLFLLDEPLAHLDAVTRRDLRAQIAGLPALLGVPMILVTHDQAEAMTLGQRLAILRDGALQQIGRPLDVYREPENTFVAGFLGSPPMNLLPGLVVEESGALFWVRTGGAQELRLEVPGGTATAWRSHVGREILAGLRPEQIRVVESGASSADQFFTADLRGVERFGAEALVRVSVAGLDLTARAPASFTGAIGGPVALQMDLRTARFFDSASGRALV